MSKMLPKLGLSAALCLFGAAAVNAQQAAAPDAAQTVTVSGQKNPSAWFQAESPHFIVFSDTSNAHVTQLVNNLEKLDHLLRIYTKNYMTRPGPAQKITLYYHNRVGSFQDLATGLPDEAVGLYNSCGSGVQGFGIHLEPIVGSDNAALAKDPLNSSQTYLFEAYARHFLYRYTDIRSPTSYMDGFAQYFSTVRFTDDHMLLGRAPLDVARYLRFIDNGHRYKLDYQQVFQPDASAGVGYTDDSAKRLEFLARSWLLTHFMLSSDENRAHLDKYLNAVYQDVPAAKAFEDAFAIKVADASTAMWRYRLKGIEVKQIDFQPPPPPVIRFTSFPEAATDFILADAALKSCPDRKRGEAILRQLSAQAGVPNHALTKLVLSRAQVDWGNPADALPYLAEAVRKDEANYDAHYLLGMANLRLSGQQKDASAQAYLQTAKRHLVRARKLNPKSAEAAFALHKAELGTSGEPPKPALGSAIAAWINGYEVNAFARSAALSFAYLGKGAEADHAFTLMATNERDPDMAKWAKDWQKRLSTGVSRSELLAEMRREPSSPLAFKEWTVATENLMRNVANSASMEESRGYIETMGLGSAPSASGEVSYPSLPSKK